MVSNLWIAVLILMTYLPLQTIAAYTGEIRLANKTGNNRGRLEIFYNKEWGSVYYFGFHTEEAKVACRQLGKRSEYAYYFRAGYGKGHIYTVECIGTEANLSSCSHLGRDNGNCDHSNDVGIECPDEGDVRLAAPTAVNDGFIEIFHNGSWGTICYDGFHVQDATVVCRQIGRRTEYSEFYEQSGYGQIWLEFINCSGAEANLSSCPHSEWGSVSCKRQAVGVRCYDGGPIPGEIRLADMDDDFSGRVEIFHLGEWGTVCDDGFDKKDAVVVCRQLGKRYAEIYKPRPGVGKIWFSYIRCTGEETRLTHCAHRGWDDVNCFHSEDVGVRCYIDGDVRLGDSTNVNKGRVEVYQNGQWGILCYDAFTQNQALVVCRQLGKRTDYVDIFRTQGDTGQIWIDAINCTGEEATLSNCSSQVLGVTHCAASNAAGVQCNIDGVVRLANSTNTKAGRLEIFHNATWGTVCDDGFDLKDAMVVCRQLDKRTEYAELFQAQPGSGEIWLDNVNCTGREANLSSCSHNGWGINNCIHKEDIGVRCYEEGKVRLADSKDDDAGRLEILHQGKWNSVCDDEFTQSEAIVACRQLGKRTADVEFYRARSGSGPMWLHDLRCNGNEANLSSCQYKVLGSSDCKHYEAVGVRCYGEGALRLVGGTDIHNGLLEMYHNRQWGTLCFDDFEEIDGRVACRQLGFIPPNVTTYEIDGTKRSVFMNGVKCNGTENRLDKCSHQGWKNHNCPREKVVGLMCFGDFIEPVHGEWGEWSPWGICTENDKKERISKRIRSCDSPAPSLGGMFCVGEKNDTHECAEETDYLPGVSISFGVSVLLVGLFALTKCFYRRRKSKTKKLDRIELNAINTKQTCGTQTEFYRNHRNNYENASDFCDEKGSDFCEEKGSDFIEEKESDFCEEKESDFCETNPSFFEEETLLVKI